MTFKSKSTLSSSGKEESFPRLRLSASMLLMNIEKSIALDLFDRYQFDNIGKNIGSRETVINICLCSCVVWSRLDVDDSRRVSHFWKTVRMIQSWAKASHEVMYLWSSLEIRKNIWISFLFQIWLNQYVDDCIATQPPIPIVSSVAKASAAALMVRWQNRLSGIEERRGNSEVRIHCEVCLDSSESFRLSVLGSRIRTQAWRSMGISSGNWSLEGIFVCLNSTIRAPIGRWRLLWIEMVASSLSHWVCSKNTHIDWML